jgi:TPR repeat protein
MAKKYYLLAAENGEADAMQNLGNIFLENARTNNSKSDYKKAKEWFQKSACLGQVKSQHNLALMMAKGEGVPTDYVTAYYWATEAYENHYKDAGQIISNLEKLMSKSDLVQTKKSRKLLYKTYCSKN